MAYLHQLSQAFINLHYQIFKNIYHFIRNFQFNHTYYLYQIFKNHQI